MPQFSITTLGCKVNQYDAAAVASELVRAGLRPARRRQDADMLVINTCCVTATAMRKSRQAIRRAVRNSPEAAVCVTGCYSDYDGARVRELLESLCVPAERIFVFGHGDDMARRLREAVRMLQNGGDAEQEADAPAVMDNCLAAGRLGPIERFPGHQRAFVKIQDGCDAFCTYCIVPHLRREVFSRSADEIDAECRQLIRSGHKEIVLCGVFLGAFGRETTIRRKWTGDGGALVALLRRLARIDNLWRIRLSSIEPADVSDELVAFYRENAVLAPHFHMPLQSGSETLLRRMNRQYTAKQYRRTVERLRNSLDRPAVTTDIIVGFPGETDDDFRRTVEVAEFSGFSKIHAFPFSAVKGTAAFQWRSECPPPGVVKSRMQELAELEDRMKADYMRQFVGCHMESLVEKSSGGDCVAMTDRYLSVAFAGRGAKPGQVVRLSVTGFAKEGLLAERTN